MGRPLVTQFGAATMVMALVAGPGTLGYRATGARTASAPVNLPAAPTIDARAPAGFGARALWR